MTFVRIVAAPFLLAAASAVAAQGTPPLPAQALPAPGPICTDRPTKSNAVCTVPTGRVQIETDLFNWSRTAAAGARSDLLLYTNPTLKLGLSDSSDVQLNIAPYAEARSRAGDVRSRVRGVGDLVVRYKQRLTAPDGPVQIGLIPYLKIPTAKRGIGNGETEGGVILPVAIGLGGATLTLVPELDLLADATDPGDRHLQAQGVANLALGVAPRTTLAVEFWTAQNWDPAGSVRQYSADAALSYLVHDDLQLDVGGNVGLNEATPDVQLYLGLSTRF